MPPKEKELSPAEQKCLAATQHDDLTRELYDEAARFGVTAAALASTPQWQERLHPKTKDPAESAGSAEPTRVAKRERRKSS